MDKQRAVIHFELSNNFVLEKNTENTFFFNIILRSIRGLYSHVVPSSLVSHPG